MPNEYHYEVITYLSDSLLADLLRALFDMFVPLEYIHLGSECLKICYIILICF